METQERSEGLWLRRHGPTRSGPQSLSGGVGWRGRSAAPRSVLSLSFSLSLSLDVSAVPSHPAPTYPRAPPCALLAAAARLPAEPARHRPVLPAFVPPPAAAGGSGGEGRRAALPALPAPSRPRWALCMFPAAPRPQPYAPRAHVTARPGQSPPPLPPPRPPHRAAAGRGVRAPL